MSKAFVYILISDKDRKSYVGSTNDLEKRTNQHFEGSVTATKYRRPLKLVYFEQHQSLEEARKRERNLKTRQGRRELKKSLKP